MAVRLCGCECGGARFQGPLRSGSDGFPPIQFGRLHRLNRFWAATYSYTSLIERDIFEQEILMEIVQDRPKRILGSVTRR